VIKDSQIEADANLCSIVS